MRPVLLLITSTLCLLRACVPGSQRFYSYSEPPQSPSQESGQWSHVPDARPGACYARALVPRSLGEPSPETMWTEVLCHSDDDHMIMSHLSAYLYRTSYLDERLASDSEILAALRNYQQDNNLPIGGLNLETLDAMSIPYTRKK